MKAFKIIVYFLLSYAGLPAQMRPAQLPHTKHHFIVVAHRGDHVAVPENTLASFQMAIQHNVDFVEIDLRTTKDSVQVIMHDATIDRMTTGHAKVNTLTYHELRSFKVMDKNHPGSKQHNIPSFEEVLQLCKGKINIYLDFKDADVKQTYALIKKHGMEKNVMVYINSENQFNLWRGTVPSMPLMISLPAEINTAQKVTEFLKMHPVELLDGDYNSYTTEMIAAAKDAGTKVLPDIQSVDEMDNWESAMRLEFDGLQTDHPEMLIAFLKLKRKR
ncbi:MAG: glycerophosphodiester phosphodiesterase family protein [Ginsengibacter sp.]